MSLNTVYNHDSFLKCFCGLWVQHIAHVCLSDGKAQISAGFQGRIVLILQRCGLGSVGHGGNRCRQVGNPVPLRQGEQVCQAVAGSHQQGLHVQGFVLRLGLGAVEGQDLMVGI